MTSLNFSLESTFVADKDTLRPADGDTNTTLALGALSIVTRDDGALILALVVGEVGEGTQPTGVQMSLDLEDAARVREFLRETDPLNGQR